MIEGTYKTLIINAGGRQLEYSDIQVWRYDSAGVLWYFINPETLNLPRKKHKTIIFNRDAITFAEQ